MIRAPRGRLALLSAGLITILVLSAVVLTAIDVIEERRLYFRQIEEKGELLASTLSEAFANALYFGDIERVRHLAAVLGTQTEISHFEIFNPSGRRLVSSEAEKYPSGDVDPDILRLAHAGETTLRRRDDGTVEVIAPIGVGSEVLGGIWILLDPGATAEQLHQQVGRELLHGGLFLLLGAALAVALALALRATDRLREAEERLRLLAENVGEVLWMTDLRTGELLYLSRTYQEIWGRTLESAYEDPESRYRAVHPDDRDRALSFARREGEEEYRIVRPDGELRWIRERSTVVRSSEGSPRLLAGAAADVTEQRRLESELLHAQKMDSLGRLAGGVAHDFNNLLTGILGFAALGEEREPTPEVARQFFHQIRKAAESGASLTQQLLSFSRHQVGEARVVDLGVLVAEREELLRRVLGEDVELTSSIASGLWRVRVDPGQFEQVLMNLAINSREAMPEGGALRIDLENSTEDEADWVRLKMTDTGVGIPEAVLDRIFEPFFSTKSDKQGTGLGLATCYGIVHQHGGRIEARSDEGRGATFEVLFPRVEEEIELRGTETPAGGIELRGTETVLVAEDDPTVRALTVTTLASLGYRVLEATDGEEALELALAHPRPIDLLLTDVVMPRMGGAELAERLVQARSGTTILFMSGYADDEARARELVQAGSRFLAKPFAPTVLASRVRRLLDRRARELAGKPG